MSKQYTKTSRSPYHKYDKRPHVYSASYGHWKGAVMQWGLGSPQVEEADIAFRRIWGIPLPRKRREGFIL